MSLAIRKALSRAFPDIRGIIREGLEPVRATGRTGASIRERTSSGGGNVILEITGHDDVQGALFGLSPEERFPDVLDLSSWISARGLNLDAAALAERIYTDGTQRGDFEFVETTQSEVADRLEQQIATQEMDDAVFESLDRLLGVRR